MTPVTGIAHVALLDGHADRFEELALRCRRVVVEKAPGTTRYDVFLTPDRTSAVVIEEYTDHQALKAHLATIGDDLSAAIPATASEVHGELLSDLSAAEIAELVGGPVRPYLPFFTTT